MSAHRAPEGLVADGPAVSLVFISSPAFVVDLSVLTDGLFGTHRWTERYLVGGTLVRDRRGRKPMGAETGPIARPAVVAESPMGDDVLIVRVDGTPGRDRGRDSGGKRAAIVRAATELFLRQGYQAPRTEPIAAAAAVPNHPVYNQCGANVTPSRHPGLRLLAPAP